MFQEYVGVFLGNCFPYITKMFCPFGQHAATSPGQRVQFVRLDSRCCGKRKRGLMSHRRGETRSITKTLPDNFLSLSFHVLFFRCNTSEITFVVLLSISHLRFYSRFVFAALFQNWGEPFETCRWRRRRKRCSVASPLLQTKWVAVVAKSATCPADQQWSTDGFTTSQLPHLIRSWTSHTNPTEKVFDRYVCCGSVIPNLSFGVFLDVPGISISGNFDDIMTIVFFAKKMDPSSSELDASEDFAETQVHLRRRSCKWKLTIGHTISRCFVYNIPWAPFQPWKNRGLGHLKTRLFTKQNL